MIVTDLPAVQSLFMEIKTLNDEESKWSVRYSSIYDVSLRSNINSWLVLIQQRTVISYKPQREWRPSQNQRFLELLPYCQKKKKKRLHHLRLNQSGIKLTAQILNDVNASRVFASHRLWRGMFTVFPQWVPPGRQRELLTAVVKTFTVGHWKNINGGFLILTLNLIKKKTGSWNWSLPHQTVAGVRTKNRTTPWLKIRFC